MKKIIKTLIFSITLGTFTLSSAFGSLLSTKNIVPEVYAQKGQINEMSAVIETSSGDILLYSDKKTFLPSEKIEFEIQKSYSTGLKGLIQRSKNTINEKFIVHGSTVNELLVTVKDNEGIVFEKDVKLENEPNIVSIDPKNLHPGSFTLTVTDTATGKNMEQDFSWGVLAINPNKSVYLTGETAKMAIAVLDEQGEMVCDAKLDLEIEKPDGSVDILSTSENSIKVNRECLTKEVTLVPDYETTYLAKTEGVYNLKLTATTKNGIFTINNKFEVNNSSNFYIERITATRVYPRNKYPVVIKVDAKKNYRGEVKELVSNSFDVEGLSNQTISENYDLEYDVENGIDTNLNVQENDTDKILTWQVDWKRGETYFLAYEYSAPLTSPEFYLLGPLSIGNFLENRTWQIAWDGTDDLILLWDRTIGAVPSGWTSLSEDTPGTYYQKFIRGAETAGGTGGSPTHTHTVSNNVSTETADIKKGVDGANYNSGTHTHSVSISDGLSGSNNPEYQTLVVIQATGVPSTIPDDVIALFNTDPGANWTRYSSQDGKYIFGADTDVAQTTGGNTGNTHDHTIQLSLGAADTGDDNKAGSAETVARTLHGHTISNQTTNAPSSEPAYKNVLLYQNTSGTAINIPVNLIGMFDAAAPSGWDSMSGSGGDFENKFLKPSSTYTGSGGGGGHGHNDITGITTGTADSTGAYGNAGGSDIITDHSHTVGLTGFSSISEADNNPEYVDTVIAKYNPPVISITGIAYTDEGSTPDISATICVRINNDSESCDATDGATGEFVITDVTSSAGDQLTLFFDGGTEFGNTITISDGVNIISGDNLKVFQGHVIVRYEQGSSITIDDMTSYDRPDNTTDIFFTAVSGTPDTLIVENGYELYIPSGFTFTPGGNLQSGTSGIDDIKIIGIYTAAATETIRVSGSWANSGTFTESTSTVLFDAGSGTETINSSGATDGKFYHITFNDSGGPATFQLNSSGLDVEGNLTITGGTLSANSQNINVKGNWDNDDTFTHGNGLVTLDANSAVTITIDADGPGGVGTEEFYDLTLNDAGGGATFQPTTTIDVDRHFTITGGTYDLNGQTMYIGGNFDNEDALTHNSGSITFNAGTGTATIDADGIGTDVLYDVTFNDGGGGATFQLTELISIDNNLTITNGILDANGKAIDVGNNWANNGGTFTSNSNTVTMDAQDAGNTLSGTMTGSSSFSNLTFDDSASSGGWTFNANATTTGNFLITNGSVTAPSGAMIVGGNFDNDDTFTHNSSSITFNNSGGGTVTIDADGTGTDALNSVVFNDSDSNTTFQITGAITTAGDLTITGGNLDLNALTLTVGGSFANNDTLTHNNGPVLFNNSGGGTVTIDTDGTGTEALYSVEFDAGGGGTTFQLSTLIDVDNDLTVTSGIFNANSNAISIGGNWDNNATFTSGTQTTTFDATDVGNTIESGSSNFSSITFSGSGGGNGTWTIQTDDATATGTLNVNTGDTLTIASGRSLTHSGATLTLDGTINGSGNLYYQSASNFPSSGTLDANLRIDGTNGDRNITDRTNGYGGSLEIYSNSGTARVFTLGTAGSQSIDVTGDLILTAAGGNTVSVDGDTHDPVVNVDGNITYTAGGSAESVTTGEGTWTVTGNVNFTNGSFTATTNNTFIMDGTTKTITSNGQTFYNFEVQTGSVTSQDTLDVNGTFDLSSSGTFTHAGGADSDIYIADDFTLANGTTWNWNIEATSQVIFDGDLFFTDSNGTKQNIGDVVIGTSPDTTYLSSDTSSNSLTVTSADYYYTCGHEVDIGNGGIVINGTFDATSDKAECSVYDVGDPETTINDANLFNLSGTGTFVPDQSTIIFDDSSGTNDLITAGSGSFYNMQINGASNTMLLKDPLDVDNNLAITAGALDAESGGNWQINVGGNWDNDAAFEARNGLVVFDAGSGTKTIDADGTGTDVFYDVTFNDGGSPATFQLTTTLDADRNLTIAGGNLSANGQNIYVGGNWDNDDTFTHGSALVTLNAGSGTVTIDADGTGTDTFNDLTINDGGGPATFQLTTAIDIDGTFNITGGEFQMNGANNINTGGVVSLASGGTYVKSTGTWTFDGTGSNNLTDSNGTKQNLGDVIVNGTTRTVSLQSEVLMDSLEVGGDDVFAMGTNNVTIGATGTTNSGGVNIAGTTSQSSGTVTIISSSGGTSIFQGAGELTANALTIGNGVTSFTVNNESNDLDIDLAGTFTITAGATFQASSTATFEVAGSWSDSGTFTENGSTVLLNATTGSPTITSNGSSFNHINFNDGGNNITFTIEDIFVTGGNFIITGGNVDTNSGESNPMTIGGAWDNDDTFTSNSSLVTFNAGSGTISIDADGTGTDTFYDVTFNDGGGPTTFQLTDPLATTNDLSIAGGNLDANGQAITVGGGWNNDDTFTHNNNLVTFNAGSLTQLIDSVGTGADNFYDVTFNDSGGTAVYQLTTTLDADRNLTNSNGTLDSNGNNITVAGNWTNDDIFSESTAKVILSGTTSTTLDSGCGDPDTCTNENFYDLEIFKTDGSDANDNVTLTSTGVRVSNTLTITDGELIQLTLNVRSEGTTAVSITSNGKWTNTSTGNLTLGGTLDNAGTATFQGNGASCGDADGITIASTAASQRSWNGAGTFDVNDVVVSYQAGSASIIAFDSTNNGNMGSNWTFIGCPNNVTGNVYDFGTSDPLFECDVDGGTYELRLRAGGLDYSASCSNVDGSFTFSSVGAPDAGDGMIFWIDDAEASETDGALVNRYDGAGVSANNVFYDDAVTITSDDTNGLSIIAMDEYDNVNDGDIPYTATDASPDTLSVNSGYELLVQLKSGVTPGSTVFDPGGTVTTNSTGGDFHIDDNATAYLDTSTNAIGRDIEIDAGATLYVDESTSVGGGDIAMVSDAVLDTSTGSPTLTLTADGTNTIGGGSGNITIHNLTKAGSGTLTLSSSGTNTINNNLSIDAGTFTLSNTLTVTGDVSVADNSTFNINANLNIDGGALTTAGSGSTIAYSNQPTVDIDGQGTLGGGSGSYTFYTLDLGDTTSDVTTLSSAILIDNSLTVNSNQTFTMGANNVTVGSTSVVGSGDITINGSTSQSSNATFTIKSSSGETAQLSGSSTLSVYNLTIGDGATSITLDNQTNNLSLEIANNFTNTANTTFQASSTGDFQVGNNWINSGIFTANNSTVTMNAQDSGNTLSGTMTGSSSFYDLYFNDGGTSGAWSYNANSVTVNNNFNIQGGAVTAPSTTLTIGGNFTNNDSFIHNSGNIVFNGSNPSTLSYSSATTFNNFTVNTSGKQINFDNVDQTNILGALTLQGGDCTTGRIFLDPDVAGQTWEINATGSTNIDYVDIEYSSAVTGLTAYSSTEENNNNSGWTIVGGLCIPHETRIKDGVRIFGGVKAK